MTEGRRVLRIVNGRVLLPTGELARRDLLLADGKIAAVQAPARQARPIGRSGDGETLDAAGGMVLPGLIDIHTHGIGRESAASETLDGFARLEAAHGATTFFPTLFGPPAESMAHMRRHLGAGSGLGRFPQVGGFRLESPYLACAGGGASRDCAPISEETTAALLDAGEGRIRIWDVSPELPGAAVLIRSLSADGILCSLAHTRASITQAREAVDAGARLVTHLFDTFVLPSPTEPGVYPAGLVDYILTEDRLACEIIGDGTHVPGILVEKALRCKTVDRLAWVTDSNFGAALPPGEYEAPGWGWITIAGPNNGARLRDRQGVLAGSALTPIDGLRNAIRLFGQDLATASRLCSATPARLLGLNKGETAPGRDADLIILDDDLGLRRAIAAGEVVYARP
jgi:N-acetylglucosamine-6-phosphate deacetylase